MKAELAMRLVVNEFRTTSLRNNKFRSRHEGFAVLLEEVDELWDAIKGNHKNSSVRMEAVQVGAMALRFLKDCV